MTHKPIALEITDGGSCQEYKEKLQNVKLLFLEGDCKHYQKCEQGSEDLD